jgi:myo-inositol-1(or 4)-monophosphatase
VDGTVNFAHGLPQYGVTVALEIDGRPAAGVTAAPALDWEFYAHRGGGAFMNGEPISVSKTVGLEHAILASGFPYDRATTKHNFAEWEYLIWRWSLPVGWTDTGSLGSSRGMWLPAPYSSKRRAER